MEYTACPFKIINAPASAVWSLLDHPENWGDFYDVTIDEVKPAGLLKKGQRVKGHTSFWFKSFEITFKITGVERKKGWLDMEVSIPFGNTNFEHMEITPMKGNKCLVKYNCNFKINGTAGNVIFKLLRKEFDSQPKDSLRRLTEAAERKFSSQKR